ncbi:MAG: TetR/AcrR family transcriptional regulator [Actinomycetota bacterium]|nr:TetR/AcrR family transcriptional regulator [Actinomycetota bacterium]
MAATGDDDAGPAVDARVVRTRNDILRAALHLVTDEGLEAVTHHHLAEVAGYSRATIYKHWPTRNVLLRDAFAHLSDGEHHTPAGDLRSDLIAEMTLFRQEMERHRLDRALAVLAAVTASDPEMAGVRDRLVTDGERVVRQLLATVLHGPELEAAAQMLPGAIVNSALLHGRLPSDNVIAAMVDLVLCSVNAKRSR